LFCSLLAAKSQVLYFAHSIARIAVCYPITNNCNGIFTL